MAGVLAGIGWAGLAIQFYLMVRAGLSQRQIVLAILNYFSYFTILTNLLIASILTISAWPPALDRETELVGLRIAAGAVVYILVVGLIYVVALRRLWNPTGLQWVADLIVHYVMPIGYPIFWITLMRRSFLRWRKIVLWLAYPLAFVFITEVRGACSGWYPYPFLDAGSLGYAAPHRQRGNAGRGFCGVGIGGGVCGQDFGKSVRRYAVCPSGEKFTWNDNCSSCTARSTELRAMSLGTFSETGAKLSNPRIPASTHLSATSWALSAGTARMARRIPSLSTVDFNSEIG